MIKQKYLQLDPSHFVLVTLDLTFHGEEVALKSVEWEDLDDAGESAVDGLVAEFLEDLSVADFK